ncbi:helix-turn-helix transcriptional regulator [Paenibacillus sp. FSL W8-0187]|uniref:Helix-turn-helix transcriptional regulator n=2 Tax=Paenibacillus TaxID=44249 RepID=A0ABY3BC18_9BACL|nr:MULTISPECIES: helix-turn-helix transcriptional regulator [Paenibacillus]MCF2719579.1 helix-turn-helix transcriptional regulator [Paenibacillus sp. UKAQ_18]AOK91588.1 transcriptional regulator [Paenibacillus polymyxa]MBY7739422.1 helix-turn-helix transcriptional regulator [Paenibacillus polymyxa]QDY83508.1 helix-turn-helix transcriptional regulator [Paenibacillus polymyxa]QNR68492.1 helix-turn-helix transcriptional regulator [Paenibacillus peoriae]
MTVIKCNIRELMAEHRIDDITELMAKSGLSRNSINKLYRETNIETTKLETLFKLCDTFNCKLSDLIEYLPGDNQ